MMKEPCISCEIRKQGDCGVLQCPATQDNEGLKRTHDAITWMHKRQLQRSAQAHGKYGNDWEERGVIGNIYETIDELADGGNYISWLTACLLRIVEQVKLLTPQGAQGAMDED